MQYIIMADGTIYKHPPGSSVYTSITLPGGATVKGLRPDFARYRRRTYISGIYNRTLLMTEFGTPAMAGMAPPVTTPTLGAGTGSGGSTGIAIGYITWRHKSGSTIVHESNPSGATASLSITGQGRSWTGLPTTDPSGRATHVAGYVSMDGAQPRSAWEREIGTASVNENVATSALGGVLSTKRGVPPYCRYLNVYHDRMWYTGDPANPYRVWFSEVGEPESVYALNYIDTRGFEPVTGQRAAGDQLVTFCRATTYDVQGYSIADFNMRKISPSVGCISHFAVVNINERLWFPALDGVYRFDGGSSFNYMLDDLRTYWRDDYTSNTSTYEDAVAVDDRIEQVYKLLIPKSSAFYYVGDYTPIELGESQQPYWTWDKRTRQDKAIGVLLTANSGRGDVYTGSCDGYVRQENVASNADDDGDTLAKKLIIRHKHFYMGDPGGGRFHGKTVKNFDAHVMAESNAWTLDLFAGDDYAGDGTTANFVATTPAGAWWVIVAGANDKLDFTEAGTARVATLAAASYSTGALLATQIQTAMNAAPGAVNTYTVSYNTTTKFFTIARATGTAAVGLTFGTGPNLATSVHPVIGFESVDLSGDTSYVGTLTVSPAEKKTTTTFRPTLVTGAGFTVQIQATSPVGMEYAGFSAAWTPFGTRPRRSTG